MSYFNNLTDKQVKDKLSLIIPDKNDLEKAKHPSNNPFDSDKKKYSVTITKGRFRNEGKIKIKDGKMYWLARIIKFDPVKEKKLLDAGKEHNALLSQAKDDVEVRYRDDRNAHSFMETRKGAYLIYATSDNAKSLLKEKKKRGI